MATKPKNCQMCGSKEVRTVLHTLEYEEEGNIFMIENVPSVSCSRCNKIYPADKAKKYVDNQLAIFRSGGFNNKAREVSKAKGMTQQQLGDLLGFTKQRVNQLFDDNNLSAQTMIKLASVIGEPISTLFEFITIEKQGNKFYIR